MLIDEARFMRQLKLEEEGINEGIEKFKLQLEKARQNGGFADSKVGTVITYQLMVPMVQKLAEVWETKITSKHASQCKTILSSIGYDKVALIFLKTLLGQLTRTQVPLITVATALTDNILIEYNLMIFKSVKKEKDDYLIYEDMSVDYQGNLEETLKLIPKIKMMVMLQHLSELRVKVENH